MTYVVKEECIKCKLMDCVEVCPVDCFYEGKNMLVIKPEECIDCGVCEPECPIDAIKPDTDEGVSDLIAHNKKTTYQTRKAWINPENKTVLKEERFAKSGKKLKRILFKDYEKIENRMFPRTMIFKDLLKENTQTTYKFDVIEFNVEIPARYFSQSILKR